MRRVCACKPRLSYMAELFLWFVGLLVWLQKWWCEVFVWCCVCRFDFERLKAWLIYAVLSCVKVNRLVPKWPPPHHFEFWLIARFHALVFVCLFVVCLRVVCCVVCCGVCEWVMNVSEEQTIEDHIKRKETQNMQATYKIKKKEMRRNGKRWQGVMKVQWVAKRDWHCFGPCDFCVMTVNVIVVIVTFLSCNLLALLTCCGFGSPFLFL